MKYRKSKMLNEIEHLHCDYSVAEIDEAITELEESIKTNFGVGFRHQGTVIAEQDLKHLYLLKERAIKREKTLLFHQLKKYLEPDVVTNLVNTVKDIDDRLVLACSLIIGHSGYNLFSWVEGAEI